MITKIRLKNFKLHADTTIEGLPITIFIGPNNSGKSSIFQALLALRQASVQESNQFLSSHQRNQNLTGIPYFYPQNILVNLGSFTDVIRPGEETISFLLEGTMPLPKVMKSDSPCLVHLETEVRKNELVLHRGTLEANGITVPWEFTRNLPIQAVTVNVGGIGVAFSADPSFRCLRVTGTPGTSGASPEKIREVSEFASELAAIPSQFISSVHPIFSLRGFEEWAYPLPDAPTPSIEMAVLADRSLASASILAYNKEMEERISDWLEEIIGIGIRVHLVPGKQLIIRTTKQKTSGAATLFTNEGSGANQLPFILMPIGLTPPDETLLISEPEVHLHPKAQSDLTKVLLRILQKENRQYFIETHSEHILHSFLHAVARGDLTRDQLAIYYFENDEGTAKVERLEIDQQGRVKGGLPGFFEHSLQELSETLESLK